MGIARKKGFTIVELLITITMIAILVTITIFAFGSWRSRTATTEVKNDLQNSMSAIKNYQAFNNAYPPDNTTFAGLYTPAQDVTLTYTLRANAASYCLKGQSTAVTSVVWYVDTAVSTDPTTTACS